VVGEELEKVQQRGSAEHQVLARQKALEAHYDRVDKIGLRDYDAAEEKAKGILGKDLTEDIAVNAEDSHAVLYFLGKNPEEAERLREIFDENPAKGTYALGKLAAGLKVQQKPKPTPNDADTPAGNGANAGGNQWARKLDKLRDEVAKGTKSMADIQVLKREAKAAGVTL
jgi:hypothetical protein